MDYTYTLELYKSLEFELENENNMEMGTIDQHAKAIEIVREKLHALEVYVKANPITGLIEEVQYFKLVYPMFYSQLIYYSECYNLEKYLQLLDENDRMTYLIEEMKLIPRFFKRNSFLYEYHRLGLSELDHIYFTSIGAKSRLMPEFPTIDFSAVTTASYSLAKIIALERLKENLQFKLNELSPEQNEAMPKTKNKMKWTGDVVNLVELAYGIHLTGQLNDGNASLNQIVRWLETNFQVSIGIVQRRFTEIGNRKRLSPTKFLDQMRENLIQKIESDNA